MREQEVINSIMAIERMRGVLQDVLDEHHSFSLRLSGDASTILCDPSNIGRITAAPSSMGQIRRPDEEARGVNKRGFRLLPSFFSQPTCQLQSK